MATTNEASLMSRVGLQNEQRTFLDDSTISWDAIFVGALASAALSLILVVLGSSFGLAVMSPWIGSGASAAAVGTAAIIWMTATQAIAAGLGGYLTGRLRRRWINTKADEAYFRDSVHGFMVWTIATLATAILLTSTLTSIIGKTAEITSNIGGAVVDKALTETVKTSNIEYITEKLLRSQPVSAGATTAQSNVGMEAAPAPAAVVVTVGGVLQESLSAGSISTEDLDYLVSVLIKTTGESKDQAKAKITAAFTKMQQSINTARIDSKRYADTARKTSAAAAIWLFFSLIVGAFVASLFAVVGGRSLRLERPGISDSR